MGPGGFGVIKSVGNLFVMPEDSGSGPGMAVIVETLLRR